MNPPAIAQRHPALRWLVPLAVTGLAGLAITAVTVAMRGGGSSDSLPTAVPASLVAAVKQNRDTTFSGTVVSDLSLGLPSISALPGVTASSNESSFRSLLSGAHTMQIWYGGRDKQRVALLDAGGETDLFRNGDEVWQWSSSDGVALHSVLQRRSRAELGHVPPEAITPAALAGDALAALDGRTAVRVDDDIVVADRPAWDLVLTPRDAGTKIGSVHVAVDGATKVPLGVQIYPKGSTSAAIDVAFTTIRFGDPAERNFEFEPPPNATVTELGNHLTGPQYSGAAMAAVAGTGWTTVFRLAPGSGVRVAIGDAAQFRDIPAVSGRWGKGRLIQTQLLSVLVTRDGRVFAGAVRPARLYAAAAAAAGAKR